LGGKAAGRGLLQKRYLDTSARLCPVSAHSYAGHPTPEHRRSFRLRQATRSAGRPYGSAAPPGGDVRRIPAPTMFLSIYSSIYEIHIRHRHAGRQLGNILSHDEAPVPIPAPGLIPFATLQGWSARVTSGLLVSTNAGPRVSLGGELGGIGSGNFNVWSVRGRIALPF
jgi:hypothetical protein